MKEPLVVYIIGDSRSGSTLLDYLLASHPDAVSIGEVHHLNGHYNREGTGKSWNWECSCGQHVDTCKLWSKILKDISFDKNFETRIKMPKSNFFGNFDRFLFIQNFLNRKVLKERGKRIAENRWKIYKAVTKETKKTIIIDSSKNADEAYFINKYKKGNVRFILLNRNIYEVAFSKRKRLKEVKQEIKSFYGLKEKSLYKVIFSCYRVFRENNLILKIIKNNNKQNITKIIDYVDLTTSPKIEIDKVCNFLNIAEFDVPTETNIYTWTPHILGGSPSRYNRKIITPDVRWKDYYKNKRLPLLLARILHKL